MSAFTPGPWEIEQDKAKTARFWLRGQTSNSGDGRLAGTGYIFLGSIGNGAEGGEAIKRAEANAKLIAAAPDLLEALREVCALLDASGFGVDCEDGVAKARVAMAKATDGA